jgi:hypothetical protein
VGDIESALATASAIHDPWSRLRTFFLIAQPSILAGDGATLQRQIPDALATAMAVEPDYRLGSLQYIALEQIIAGDIGGAMATARTLEGASERPVVLVSIAWAQAATGDRAGAGATLEQALTEAESIEVPQGRDAVLAMLALAQANLQRGKAGLATADRIGDSVVRAEALGNIASGKQLLQLLQEGVPARSQPAQ